MNSGVVEKLDSILAATKFNLSIAMSSSLSFLNLPEQRLMRLMFLLEVKLTWMMVKTWRSAYRKFKPSLEKNY